MLWELNIWTVAVNQAQTTFCLVRLNYSDNYVLRKNTVRLTTPPRAHTIRSTLQQLPHLWYQVGTISFCFLSSKEHVSICLQKWNKWDFSYNQMQSSDVMRNVQIELQLK